MPAASHRVRPTALVVLLVTTLLLAPTALSVPRLADAADASVAPSEDSWAYGTERWFNLTLSTPNGVHTIRAHMAWYTIFERTNPTASTVGLSVDRTVASDFTARYCSPDCSQPTLEVNLAHAVYAHALGGLNLSRDARVYEAGSAVPALGVVNSSAAAVQTVASTAGVEIATPSGPRTVRESFRATAEASATLAFEPSLGLVPWSVAVGDVWNASSTYVGAGAWRVNWTYEKTNASGGTTTLSGTPSGALNTTGTLSVNGTAVARLPLPNGSTLPAISLGFSESFEALDGVIYLPRGSGFFEETGRPWDGYRMAFDRWESKRLSLGVSSDGASFAYPTASAVYGTNDTAVSIGEGQRGAASASAQAAVAVAVATGVPATEVVAAPVPVPVAEAAADCLAGGACPAPVGSRGPGLEPVALYLVLGGVVTAAVAVAVLLVRHPHRS